MPIQLTDPLHIIPEVDPDQDTYTQVKIVSFTRSDSFIDILCEYGNTVDGVWHAGRLPPKGIPILGTDKDTLENALSLDGEKVFTGAARLMYQYLLDNNIYSGTIVE